MFDCLPQRKVFLLLTILFCATSCIDKGYDLGDLDTDELDVGDKWSLSLGTGVLSAADLLDVENVDEIYTDANGDFIARFTDEIPVMVGSIPTIPDQRFAFPPSRFEIPDPSLYPASGFTIGIPAATRQLDVRGSREVLELHRAIFNTAEGRSLFTVGMQTQDILLAGATVTVEITLPEGYLPEGGSPPPGVSVTDNYIKWTFMPDGGGDHSVALPVESIDGRGDNTAVVEGSINIPAGLSVPAGPSPQATFSIGLENLDYRVIYGRFDVELDSFSESADIGTLYDIFDGEDAVLSFRNPYITVDAESNIGMPLTVDLDIFADRGSVSTGVPAISLPAAEAYDNFSRASFWIGETAPASGEYIFRYAEGLSRVVGSSRENIILSGSGRPVQGPDAAFFPRDPLARLDYTIEIPLAPASDFYAVSVQSLEDAFSDDMVEYLFSGGTAELFGRATNSLPLAFDLEMTVTDSEGAPLGVTFPVQQIAGPASRTEPSVSEIVFLFDESAMARMEGARDMVLRFIARGIDDAPPLNEAHRLVLELKIRKSGGIQVGSRDDE